MLAKFGRRLASNAHIYVSATPAALVQEELVRRAHKRHLPSSRDVDGRKIQFADMLSLKVGQRLADWIEEAARSGYDENDEMIIDLSNNVGWASVTPCMPAITRKRALELGLAKASFDGGEV